MQKQGFWYFFHHAMIYVYFNYISVVLIPFMIKKFIIAKKSVKNIYNAIDLAFSFQFLGLSIQPVQIKSEILRLLEIIIKKRPQCIIELGTCHGGTLFLFLKAATSNAVIISIDIRKQKYRQPLYENFKEDQQEIQLIRGDSHTDATFKNVKKILQGRKIDFLFIDADHTYEGVKKDFEMYSPLVGKGGIIAFHDIWPHPINTGYEVDKFWNEIKNNYRTEEIIEERTKYGMGIGVLFLA